MEFVICLNIVYLEVIIDSNNVYVWKQSQGFFGDDDYDFFDCEIDLGGMVLFYILILYLIFIYCSYIFI